MSNLIENKDYKILLTDELPEWVGGTCCYPIFPFLGIGTCTVKIKNKYKFVIWFTYNLVHRFIIFRVISTRRVFRLVKMGNTRNLLWYYSYDS